MLTLLCLAIALYLFIRRPSMPAIGWIVGAFAFSFAGDYVLQHWGGGFEGFVLGVALFLIAHLAYVGYSLRGGRLVWSLLTLLVIVFGAYYGFLLRPAISDAVTSGAVLAYILVSCLSMAAAVGWGTRPASVDIFARVLYILGIASLLFSDLLIAEKRFLHHDTLYSLMMPTYYASQFLVTAALLRLCYCTKVHHKS